MGGVEIGGSGRGAFDMLGCGLRFIWIGCIGCGSVLAGK